MKNPFLKILSVAALCAGAVFVLHSCTKIATLVSFDLSMQPGTVNFTIPVIKDTTGVFTVGGTNSFNVDSFVRAKTGGQFGATNITSVKLSSVLVILNNATATSNFQDFASCYASFYSNTNTTPYTVSVPDNTDTAFSATLSMPVDTTAELKTYIGTDFTYSITGRLHDVTFVPLQGTVTYTFSLKVQG